MDTIKMQFGDYGFGSSLFVALITLALGLFWAKIRPRMDSREPPLLSPSIPVVGHILGMLRYHMLYFKMLSAKQTLPAFTMSNFGSKSYVIQSPLLAQSAYRSKKLSFEPFLAVFAQRLFGVDNKAMNIVHEKSAGKENLSLLERSHKSLDDGLAQGAELDRIKLTSLNRMMTYINKIDGVFQPDTLYLWLRNLLTDASAAGLFGRYSPFDDKPSLVDSLWDFDENFISILIGFLPSIIAPAAYRGRSAVQSALMEYYSAHHEEDPTASHLIRNRAALFREYGFTPDVISKFELFTIYAGTLNNAPTLFWFFVHVFSDAALVQQIRAEVLTIIVPDTDNDTSKPRSTVLLDSSKLRTHCPLLQSTLHETLRLTNAQTSNRLVIEDTVISSGRGPEAQSYLLKKGSIVMLPAGVMHTDESTWGPNAATFDARRFLELNTPGATLSEEQKLQKKSFIPFGGGSNICPGRWFTAGVVLGFVATMTLGFEVSGADDGPVPCPVEDRWQKIIEGVGKPTGKALSMGVKIRRRPEFKDVEFALT